MNAHRYILSLGSNSPDKVQVLPSAIDSLGSMCRVLRQSHIYSTPALGGIGPDYLNAVVEVESDHDRNTINRLLKELELSFGRNPSDKARGIVQLDIDIVIADGSIIRPTDYSRSYFTIGYQALPPAP